MRYWPGPTTWLGMHEQGMHEQGMHRPLASGQTHSHALTARYSPTPPRRFAFASEARSDGTTTFHLSGQRWR
eukprot:344517-Chlamydomonas_euryale.AAC.3